MDRQSKKVKRYEIIYKDIQVEPAVLGFWAVEDRCNRRGARAVAAAFGAMQKVGVGDLEIFGEKSYITEKRMECQSLSKMSRKIIQIEIYEDNLRSHHLLLKFMKIVFLPCSQS